MIADLWVVLTVLAFFAVCVAFVRGCDRIIGPDDAEDFSTTSSRSSAPTDRDHRGGPVTGENIAGLVLAALLSLYLVAALLFPEKF